MSSAVSVFEVVCMKAGLLLLARRSVCHPHNGIASARPVLPSTDPNGNALIKWSTAAGNCCESEFV